MDSTIETSPDGKTEQPGNSISLVASEYEVYQACFSCGDRSWNRESLVTTMLEEVVVLLPEVKELKVRVRFAS
jgi:hypothetical protein